jgi:cell division initiation protein
MLLTLENIQNQQFNQRFRGYDMAEVDAFLDKIAESYLFLSTENGKIKEELNSIKNERNQSMEEEQSFKNAIISAQSFADDIKTKAEKLASRLKEDAKKKSTAILEEAQSEVSSLQDQIGVLAGEKERIKDELRQFLQSYLSQVESDAIGQSQAAPAPSAKVVNMDQIPGLMDDPEPVLEVEEPAAVAEEQFEIEQADSDETSATQSKKEDVAILYEKIDLDDDLNLDGLADIDTSEPPAAMSMEIDTSSIPEFSTDELDDLPTDLDGDMLYSLEDPLDIPEPAVIIEPLDEKNK